MIRRLAVLAFFLGCGGSDEGLPADGAIRDTNPSEAPGTADAPLIDAPSVDAPSIDAPMIDAATDAEPPDAAPLTNGQPCSMATDCASGQCADGVCCNVDCSGRCRACNLAGSVGTCTFHGAGSDPENEM